MTQTLTTGLAHTQQTERAPTRADIAAAYRAGAEAMREAIRKSIRACHFDLKNSGPMTDALAAIDATPLPEPEDQM
jgi:hypothetical protein